MKVQYFTFVINPVEQPSFFTDSRPKGEIFKDYLLGIKQPIKFINRNGVIAITPSRFQEGNYAIFDMGKKDSVQLSGPPETDFASSRVDNWPHSKLLFNFDSSPEGQKIVVEFKPEIFREPYIQLHALAKKINEDLSDSGYAVEINPVTTEVSFWETVEQFEGEISRMEMTFDAPNLLNLKNKLSDDLKDIQKLYRANKITLGLENTEGKLIVPRTDLMEQGAEYVTKGQGTYKLKVKSHKGVIKDKDNIETRTVVDIDLSSNDRGLIFKALEAIFKDDV